MLLQVELYFTFLRRVYYEMDMDLADSCYVPTGLPLGTLIIKECKR